jgi:hypothetical protein
MHKEAIAALPLLAPRAMATLTGRTPSPVGTYRAIVSQVGGSDLRTEDSEPLRRRFNGFYGVRRNATWRTHFYERFETAKSSPLNDGELFADILRDLEAATGRVEASFVSKLVATLHPERAIIDSVVRKWLASLAPAPRFSGGAEGVIVYYGWLNEFMVELSLSGAAQDWLEAFEAAFPTPPGQSEISAMKRLDFIIWAGAER